MTCIPLYDASTKKIARYLARLAVKALYYEVKAYPKPGLVSFVDAGAHDDMDGSTFYRSLSTLRHYFYEIVLMGLTDASFDALKQRAISAEHVMFLATKGVNTHRGAIFALGLCCISSARLIRAKRLNAPQNLHGQLIRDWAHFLQYHQTQAAIARDAKVLTDATQMAREGYWVVFEFFSRFISLYEKTRSLDDCCLYAYGYLLWHIDDTNILHRCGWDGLMGAKKHAYALLEESCLVLRRHKALKLHDLFSSQRISPGGVGDLIAVLLFIGQLFHQGLRCHL
jgi:triphosphoribosyl-dephospho-CoA synthase